MRIAFLADFYPPHNRGGAGIVVRRLARHFAAEGNEILVVTTVQETEQTGVGESDGVRIVRIFSDYRERFRNFVGVLNPRILSSVRRELRSFRPDVVHAHNVHHHLSFASLRVASGLGLPVVLTSHDFLMFCCDRLPCASGPGELMPRWTGCVGCQRFRYNPLRRLAIRWLIGSTVREILAISDLMRRSLELNGFHDIRTVHNGLAVDEWPLAGHSDRVAGNSRTEPPIVLLQGRLSAYKGTEALLDAVANLTPADRPRVVFAGDNPRYEPALRAYADRLGLGGGVEISGWLDQADLAAAIAGADVVATPSTYPDPFNLGNIEAMSTGRPVLASSLGGGPEIVADGETGYVVDPFDADYFSERLSNLLKNPDLRRRFGGAGRRRVEELFTVERQARLTMAAYLRAASG